MLPAYINSQNNPPNNLMKNENFLFCINHLMINFSNQNIHHLTEYFVIF